MGSFTTEALQNFVRLGPCQPRVSEMPGGTFPHDKNKLSFLEKHYSFKMPDGTFVTRNWLTYSPSLDKVFCFSCILFGSSSSKHISFVKNGTNNWKNIHQTLKTHELNEEHLKSEIARSIFISSTQRIDIDIARTHNTVISQNREVVQVLINVVYYLAKHNLALRGKDEKLKNAHKVNLGNFLDLVFLLSNYHPFLNRFLLDNVTSDGSGNKTKKLTFLSNKSQNLMLNLTAEVIRERILNELRDAKFFSVIIDTTTDLSKKDQFSFVVRYTRMNNETRSMEVVERLIALDVCENATGEGMFTLFKEICEKHNINWRDNLIGKYEICELQSISAFS